MGKSSTGLPDENEIKVQEPRQLFISIRTRVKGSEKAKNEYRAAHVAYLTRLRDEGILLMGGPFEDDSGGLNIFSVGSQEEAMELCRNDPFVAHGVSKSDVKAWSLRHYH